MKYFLIILMSLFLSGCVITDYMCKDVILSSKTIELDTKYYEECKPLVSLADNAQFYDVISTTAQNTLIYAECRDKLRDNILILRKLTNNE